MKTKQLAALLVIALLLVGYLEYRNAPTEAKLRSEYAGRFIRPLPCDAIVAQRGAGEQWQTRCYFSPTDKAKQ